MIAHFEIEQGSEEWLKIRYAKIGGTRSTGLFVESETLAIELLGEIIEDIEIDFDSYINSDMQRGNEFEPIARQRLSEYLGINLLECGWLQSKENSLLGISPDGITEDLEVTCEIKCPDKKKHIATCLKDEIPKDNIRQCIHYFTVNPNLKKHYFLSFRPEFTLKPMFIKELNIDSLVDIGWTKKTKVKEDRGHGEKEYVATISDVRSVREWVEIARSEEVKLKAEINTLTEQLKF